MSQNSNTEKFVNVSEMTSQPIHVPIVVGNEHYIVTQVDVRRIEDTRHITYNKVMQTGELSPQTQLDADFQQNLLNTFRLIQKLLPNACFNDANLNDFIGKLVQRELQQYHQAQPIIAPPEPMEIDGNNANIAQQLAWYNKYGGKMFPLHNTQGTSTTETSHDQRNKHKRITFETCCPNQLYAQNVFIDGTTRNKSTFDVHSENIRRNNGIQADEAVQLRTAAMQTTSNRLTQPAATAAATQTTVIIAGPPVPVTAPTAAKTIIVSQTPKAALQRTATVQTSTATQAQTATQTEPKVIPTITTPMAKRMAASALRPIPFGIPTSR